MSASQEHDANGPVTYDQKVKFQTFGYQGLPILYILGWFFSVGVLVDEKVIDAPPFFFVLLIVTTLLLIEWWFRRRFIGRNEGEDWVTVGQQLTEKCVWAEKYEISKLNFRTVKRNAGEDSSINYVQLFYEGEKILDCPGSKQEMNQILPELRDTRVIALDTNHFVTEKNRTENQVKPQEQEQIPPEKENFWSNIQTE